MLYTYYMVSPRPRVGYAKLFHECQRHECNNAVIARVPDGTSVITCIPTSVRGETILYHSRYFWSCLLSLEAKITPKEAIWTVHYSHFHLRKWTTLWRSKCCEITAVFSVFRVIPLFHACGITRSALSLFITPKVSPRVWYNRNYYRLYF